MRKILTFLTLTSLLTACGSPQNVRQNPQQLLVSALVAQNQQQIEVARERLQLGPKDNQVINLYLLALADQPYQLLSHSQQLVRQYHQYNAAQKNILKPMLLWAYAHPIYRQETAKQVRLLQRETLLVAPSEIDFKLCESNNKGCSNTLRQQMADIAAPVELTEILTEMANNDPCINLTDENVGGDLGNLCLASRKGDLKINLLSKPRYLSAQWQAMLNPGG
ncbi:hypothetical protein [Marinicella meishanensis]|uniref:hypothetical protein n=1 Tax=Marinicella meishanensis TaxID=2873263 RepID=UPI001CC01D87|nr:hypothetical protein [Marinicella sp. NBU2979]